MIDKDLLETERLRLRGWNPAQIDDLVRLHGDAGTAAYLSGNGEPWTYEQCAKALLGWIELFESSRMGKLRLERKSDGMLVGRCGFGIYPPTGEPEIGFALFPQFRGQGYASEAATALRDWLFAETEWDHFIGFADVRNTASLATLARIGMKPTHVAKVDGFDAQFHILRKADADA